MGRYGHTDRPGSDQANLVGVGFHAKHIEFGNSVIERALVPEGFLGTADATMTGLDGEGNPVIPFDCRASIVGGGSFAAHFIKAIAFAGGLVIPLLDKLAGIEMRSSITFVVDALTVEHFRTALSVKVGKLVEGQHIGDDRRHDFGDGRATGDFDDQLVENDFQWTGVARVGFGLAAWTQPQDAQEPQAMTAAQSLAA